MKKKITTTLVGVFVFGLATGILASQLMVLIPQSPYLKYSQRLGDVLAAIQVMATYKSDNNPTEIWQDAIGPIREGKWSEVFAEHPEFFRTDEKNKVSLVWRRARQWSWDTRTRKNITEDEIGSWTKEEKDERLVREPLTPEQTAKLLEIAISMQTQAIARQAELRWWVPVLSGLAGIVLGAFLGGRSGSS